MGGPKENPAFALFLSDSLVMNIDSQTAETILVILSYVGWICGTIAFFMLGTSLIFGADLDFDTDIDLDADVDDGGVGIVKGTLTFLTVCSFTIRAILLNSEWSWLLAISIGLVAGGISIALLGTFLRFLLSQQKDGSFEIGEAQGQQGEVYIPIPKIGMGKIIVSIKGAPREIKACSELGVPISTGTAVMVVETDKNSVTVIIVED